MPTYTFFIYSTDVLSFNSGTGEFDFDASYQHWEDRYRIEVSDDDNVMDAGGDANQFATIYDMDGNIIDSGVINVPMYAELADGNFLDRVEIDGVHYGYLPMDPLTPGESYAVEDSDTETLNHTYYQANSVPCFGPTTLIDTPKGPKPIARLCVGDEVCTLDHSAQRILWAGRRDVSLGQALANPKLRPTLYFGGLRGLGQPSHPLTLSQNHRVLIADPVADLFCGDAQVFVEAGWVTPTSMPNAPFSWHHIMLPHHEVIRANGIWVESLFFGQGVQDITTPAHRGEMAHALGGRPHRQTARMCLRRYEARVLLPKLRKAPPNYLSKKRVA